MSTTEAGGETPAKLYVCPACGNHYDEPTTCSNGHEPTQTVEYDRATFEAAQAGDAAALASVAATALAAGNTAGVSVASAEAAPPPMPVDAPPPPPTMVGDAQETTPVGMSPVVSEAPTTAVDPTGTPAGGATSPPVVEPALTEPTDPAEALPVAPGAGVDVATADEPTPAAEEPVVEPAAPAVSADVAAILAAVETAVEDAAAAVRAAKTALGL